MAYGSRMEADMKKLIIAIALGICALAFAQERFDKKVRGYFFSGYSGDAAALEQGMKICEDALAANPNNPEAMVWHGSGFAYKSFDAFRSGDQAKGISLWQKGTQEMDAAVALAPDNVGVRIPRGAFLLTSSHFMHDPALARSVIQTGVADFERTYELQKDRFAKLGTHPRGELLLGLADGYSRLGDQQKAAQWFERIKTELKGTAYEESANLWLQTKSLPAKQAGCLGCHTGN
jgi:tetratricopeptide (TPR) repeat protein